ncbi:cytochrome P450 [Xylaria sp. FL1042]|nr:cytochrome P450 [Xylaria sp. FL1042]
MASSIIVVITILLCIVSSSIAWSVWSQIANSCRLPPGPVPWPLVGNILDLPPRGYPEWEHWIKHKDLYGPISSVSVMGTTIIILHSADIAFELLGKRSAIYSSRPGMVFGGEMCGWNNITAVIPYGEKLRSHRKWMYAILGTKSSVARFNALQEAEVHKFLFRLLEKPQDFHQHSKAEAGAIILKLTYGYSVDPQNSDPLVELADSTNEVFSAASVPGVWLVDIIPALRYVPEWFPGCKFKRQARDWKRMLTRLADQPYQFAKRKMSQNGHEPSVVSVLREQISKLKPEEDEDAIKWTAASLYTAGADTTENTVTNFFMAMLLNPEIQKNAREEIDRVVGTKRLPNFNDRPHLPYIEAIVTEIYRWHPVAPLSMPHVTVADDEYNGYFIPKGAVVIPSTWWFTHDPEVYPNPNAFNPQRYLGSNPARDPRGFAFGYGRRTCPGKLLADASIWLNIACILAAFDITKPKSEEGEAIEPDVGFTPGIISHAMPFRATIRPRSNDHEALIREVGALQQWESNHAQEIRGMEFR